MKKANHVGTLRPKEQHDAEIPGFSLCLVCMRQRDKEAGHLVINNADKKPNKSLFSQAKGSREEQPSKTENLRW